MNTLTLSVIPMFQQLSQRERWTRQQLEAHQANSLRQLREFVYQHSPFYREFHKGLANAPLHELPVLTKALMLEHFDDVVTDRAIRLTEVRAHLAQLRHDEQFLGRYWVTSTSGSSGHPGPFLFNRSEWVTIIAAFGRSQRWGGLKVGPPHRVKEAMVTSATPWFMSTRLGWSATSWWTPSLRLDVTQPVGKIVEQLNAWQPEALQCYPTAARILADEQLAGRLRIAPKQVFASSEVLTDDTRRRIEAAWGKQSFNQYASTETGCAAAECEQHQGLHLSEDLVIFEIVDENNHPVPPGVFGEKALITVLFNRTQPLIRYELNDSARRAATPCRCGRPYALVDAIQGRMEDVLRFPAVRGGEVAVHPNVFDTVMDMVPATGWQVVLEAEGLRVLISGVHNEFVDKTLEDALRKALDAQGMVVPPIRVERVPVIPRGPTGKAPLIKCNLSHSSIAQPSA